MKKLIAVAFVVSLIIVLFSSCRSHHTCPAYHNGSADNTPVVETTKA